MSKIEELAAIFSAGPVAWKTNKKGMQDTWRIPDHNDRQLYVGDLPLYPLTHDQVTLLLEAAQLIIELSDNCKAEEDDKTFDKALDLAEKLKA